jgi:hypothetical protein
MEIIARRASKNGSQSLIVFVKNNSKAKPLARIWLQIARETYRCPQISASELLVNNGIRPWAGCQDQLMDSIDREMSVFAR